MANTPDASNVRTAGPGASYVGVAGIIGMTGYLTGFAALLLYILISIWPTPTPARTPRPAEQPPVTQTSAEMAYGAPEPTDVHLFGCTWKLWDETRLLILIICSGALGSLVHGLRSIYWYVGNRDLVWSWSAKYLLLPFSGATLAVLFYFVIRGGFFSPQAGFEQTSPFGFCALGSLVGLFSEQAVLKLKQIAETVFTKPERGTDDKPPKN